MVHSVSTETQMKNLCDKIHKKNRFGFIYLDQFGKWSKRERLLGHLMKI